MADDNIRAAVRRRRVQMLKICIVLTGLMVFLLPHILCFILLGRIRNMDKSLSSLAIRVEALTNMVAIQRGQLDELAEAVMITGGGSVREGNAGNNLPGGELELPQGSPPEAGGSGTAAAGEQFSGSGAGAEAAVTRKVYLTFDDGPSRYTGDILDILDRYGVKATFFVVGKQSNYAKAALREIVARGHTLGMHSYTHRYTEIYNSLETFAEDYNKIRNYLFEVTGVDSKVYRFPGGGSNSISDVDMWEFADYLDMQGVRFFDWNIDSGDGGTGRLAVEQLVKNSTAKIERFETSVILLHDATTKSTTVEALPIIIENILALEDTVILPITEDTELVQHIQRKVETPGD